MPKPVQPLPDEDDDGDGVADSDTDTGIRDGGLNPDANERDGEAADARDEEQRVEAFHG